MGFTDFFTSATSYHPYPYQIRLAENSTLPTLMNAPTGAGKTEAIVLAWLWRRLEHPEQTVRQNTPPAAGLLPAHACSGRADP
jgi:CRISPR-associated endonuclease/helicase Cas3